MSEYFNEEDEVALTDVPSTEDLNETESTESESNETETTESESNESESTETETETTESESTETESNESESTESESTETETTESNENESNETEPLETEEFSNPWDDAPENMIYYEKMYDDGHLGSFTESAELAYKFGWFNNRIPLDAVEKSDINGWTYLKERCPHKTQEQLATEAVNNRIREIQSAVQNLLDTKAQEKLYDDAFAICSYANSTDEAFHAEANQFISWRDRCWRKCYEILAQFQSGEIEMPTVEYVINELPTLTWN